MSELNLPTKLYIITIMLAGFALFMYAVFGVDAAVLDQLLFFAILAIIFEAVPVKLPRGGYVSVAFVIVYTTFIVLGTHAAIIAAVVGNILGYGLRAQIPLHKIFFNGAQLALSVGAAAFAFHALGGTPGQVEVGMMVPVFCGALVYIFANTLFFTVVISLAERMSLTSTLNFNVSWLVGNYFILLLMSILVSWLYLRLDMIGVAFFIIPLLLARYVFTQYMKLRDNYQATIQALVRAIEAKDPTTHGHSERVAEYTVKMARKVGLEETRVEKIRFAALLHDTGKIGIGEDILNKPASLDHEEYEQIKKHPQIGADIVSQIEFLEDCRPLILHHHERYDGQGYPEGLKGEDIPLGARLLAVPDAYDAMTSRRPYRPPLTKSTALGRLEQGAGTQFDPDIVSAFFSLIAEEEGREAASAKQAVNEDGLETEEMTSAGS